MKMLSLHKGVGKEDYPCLKLFLEDVDLGGFLKGKKKSNLERFEGLVDKMGREYGFLLADEDFEVFSFFFLSSFFID